MDVGVATEGGAIHISTGTYYLLSRYLLFWCHGPNGVRARERAT